MCGRSFPDRPAAVSSVEDRFSLLAPLVRQRPSLLLEEKVPQAAAWGGCGVRYTVTMIGTFRRKRTAVTPHQSRFARQLLPKARFAVLKEKPLVEPLRIRTRNDPFPH